MKKTLEEAKYAANVALATAYEAYVVAKDDYDHAYADTSAAAEAAYEEAYVAYVAAKATYSAYANLEAKLEADLVK